MLSTASASARRVLSRAVSVMMLVAAAGPGMPRRAAAEDLAAVLARPISTGSVALLADHATQPAAQKRLIEAVKHEDPAVRAVAARVAFVTMSKGAASALIATVAKEDHIHTGAEQVRALMALLGAPGDTIVINAVKRLGAPAALAMAESLGRTRPEDLPRHLPTLMDGLRPHEVRELAAVLATAGAQNEAQAGNILAAVLAAKNEELTRALFISLQTSSRRLPPAALLAGLMSQDEPQRILTLRHVLFLSQEGTQLPEDVLAAAAPMTALTWEAFIRELIARQRGARASKAEFAALLALPANKEQVEALNAFAYVNLTDAEVKAIDTVNGNGEADKIRSAARREQQDKQKAGKAPTQTTRTLPVFAKGLLADLMAVHGCKPIQTPSFATEAVKERNPAFVAAEMKYRPDGRPQSISIVQTALSQECLSFVRSAMTLTVSSPDSPAIPDKADLVLVYLARDLLACADNPFAASRPRGPDVAYEQPKVTRPAVVLYPPQFRRTGMPDLQVVMRVRVSPAGCPSGAEVLRGVLPAFDLEAIGASLASKVTPATLGGEPIDGSMTRAVTFTLR